MNLKSLKTNVILLLSTFCLSSNAFSVIDWTQFGVRPLAMGNAFVAVADDFNALYYNPAGLARIKEWKFEIINPRLDVSTNSYFLYKRVKSRGTKKTSDILNIINDAAGKPNQIGFTLSPYAIGQGWGFGLASTTYVSALPSKLVNVETAGISRILLPISLAKNFFSDRLSLGASVKLTGLIGITEDFSVDTLDLFTTSKDSTTTTKPKFTDYLISGMGVGVDLGLLFTPTDYMSPTFGMSVTDFGGTPLKKIAKKGTKAPSIPPTVNTGFSFKPIKSAHNYLLLAIDNQMINRSVHYSHQLSYGLEWGLYDFLKVELGALNGNATAGIQLDFTVLKIRFATYAVDRSPLVGLSRDFVDRRVALQLKLII